MPNKIEKLPDGKIHAELETGEIFEGDPLEITQKMADAHVSTKRWGQGFKQQLEAQQAGNSGSSTTATSTDPQEAQLQQYLLTQTAKALGYDNAEEYKADLLRVKATTSEVNNQLVASAFLAQCPDFPNDQKSIDALSKKIDEMGWGFDPQSMIAAHALLVREHSVDQAKGYAPLTQAQINATWEAELRASNRPQAPPIIASKSPDGSQQGFNPWDTKNVKIEDLRAMAIREQLEGKQ